MSYLGLETVKPIKPMKRGDLYLFPITTIDQIVTDEETNERLSEYLDKNFGMDLLWQNASTSSDFAPQTISLDLSKYRLCLIEFLLGKGGNVSQHEICSVGNQTRIIVGVDAGNANKALVRAAVTTTTSVQFTDAQSISGTTIATANNVLIPYKIFGIK